ncbi:hypothetical protein F0U61_45425 [Archangium violaceum]|uniref:hypothetical protein n=1 Tax=Archangium violaceum TaxID=83451 RepID=UPI002B2DB2D2|nr:hypothetical protein F0U61_45425 [Archangium violaceum]
MWRHLLGAAFVLVPGLLGLQAWRFLRLSGPTPGRQLRGLPRCTAAELSRLRPGERAVVEGRVAPASPGAGLPALSLRKKTRKRGTRTLEAWRELPSTPPIQLETEEGRVLLVNGDYTLRFPRRAEAPGEEAKASRALRKGDLACALVSLEEPGRTPRARAEWLYAAPLERYLSEVPVDVRLMRWAVAALCGTSALGALWWGWLS